MAQHTSKKTYLLLIKMSLTAFPIAVKVEKEFVSVGDANEPNHVNVSSS